MNPANKADNICTFAKMRRRFSQDQLGHLVASKFGILKHQARLWRNNKWRVRDDEIEFLAGDGLEKTPFYERHIVDPVKSCVHRSEVQRPFAGVGSNNLVRVRRSKKCVYSSTSPEIKRFRDPSSDR